MNHETPAELADRIIETEKPGLRLPRWKGRALVLVALLPGIALSVELALRHSQSIATNVLICRKIHRLDLAIQGSAAAGATPKAVAAKNPELSGRLLHDAVVSAHDRAAATIARLAAADCSPSELAR